MPKQGGGDAHSPWQAVDGFRAELDESSEKLGAKIVQEIQSAYGFRRYRALDLEGHEWCFAVKTGE